MISELRGVGLSGRGVDDVPRSFNPSSEVNIDKIFQCYNSNNRIGDIYKVLLHNIDEKE